MQGTQRLSFLSPAMEEEIKTELVTFITETFQELSNKAGNSKEWMSKKESCVYLSVSNNTFDRYINDKGLKVVTIEGVRRFKRTDLDEFYLKHKI
ncbi:helix-turn-helix domain-containing protein [Carnobacterium jeotgali]